MAGKIWTILSFSLFSYFIFVQIVAESPLKFKQSKSIFCWEERDFLMFEVLLSKNVRQRVIYTNCFLLFSSRNLSQDGKKTKTKTKKTGGGGWERKKKKEIPPHPAQNFTTTAQLMIFFPLFPVSSKPIVCKAHFPMHLSDRHRLWDSLFYL